MPADGGSGCSAGGQGNVVEACRWLADADTTPMANARRTIRRHGAGARHRSSEIIGPALTARRGGCLAARAASAAFGDDLWPLSNAGRD
jgi:hypothetical protein